MCAETRITSDPSTSSLSSPETNFSLVGRQLTHFRHAREIRRNALFVSPVVAHLFLLLPRREREREKSSTKKVRFPVEVPSHSRIEKSSEEEQSALVWSVASDWSIREPAERGRWWSGQQVGEINSWLLQHPLLLSTNACHGSVTSGHF